MDGSSRPMDPGASQREEKATGQQMLLLFGRTAFFNGYLIYVYSRVYSTIYLSAAQPVLLLSHNWSAARGHVR
jgi:hypothetical protein